MSWGSLNNQRNRKTTDPLPGFLIENETLSHDDAVVRRSDRPYTPIRNDASKGYGVAYPGSVSIQMSKKSIFLSMLFFTFSVLLAFCIGFFIGEQSIANGDKVVSTKAKTVRKPIVPKRTSSIVKKEGLEGNRTMLYQDALVSDSLVYNKNDNKKESEIVDEKDTQPGVDDNDDLN
jgi:hypothetical protein